MAYQFAGFLVPSEQDIVNTTALPEGAILRPIASPFFGIGIRLPTWVGKAPAPSEVNALATELGVVRARSWLYIGYETWGRIDSVYAIGAHEGTSFGPIDDSNLQTVESTYIETMSRIGVSRGDALRFAPFERSFWAPQSVAACGHKQAMPTGCVRAVHFKAIGASDRHSRMITTKTELLERIRTLWEAASLELGALRSTDGQPESAPRLGVYERVSELLPLDDDLADLASWAFNQSVDRLARANSAPKSMRVLVESVTLDLFDEMMRSNLEHGSWAEEELVWRNTPDRLHDIN